MSSLRVSGVNEVKKRVSSDSLPVRIVHFCSSYMCK
jgi:hypothetical protein